MMNIFNKSLLFFLLFCSQFLFAEQKDELQIKQVIVAQDIIAPGDVQLIEVQINNTSNIDRTIFVRINITLPDGEQLFHGKERVVVKRSTIESVFFRYQLEETNVGRYLVAGFIYDQTDQLLVASPLTELAAFITENADRSLLNFDQSGRATANQIGLVLDEDLENEERATKKSKEYTAPQVIIEEIKVLAVNTLVGQPSRVSVKIRNIGGDVARLVKWSLFYDIRFQIDKLPENPFYESIIDIISPGETKLFEIPVFILAERVKGSYFVFGYIDFNSEYNKDNLKRSSNAIIYRDTILIKPVGTTVNVNDALEFEWISSSSKRFFVEISIDKSFEDQKLFLRLPRSAPISAFKIALLPGELAIAFSNFLEDNQASKLYWRIIGFDKDKNRSVSNIAEFFLEK